jgi:hypothetical protein
MSWSIVVSMEFLTEKEALRFERYLKSGSGRAWRVPVSRAVMIIDRSSGVANPEREEPQRHRARLIEAVLVLTVDTKTL